jgi:hypothetical protein
MTSDVASQPPLLDDHGLSDMTLMGDNTGYCDFYQRNDDRKERESVILA